MLLSLGEIRRQLVLDDDEGNDELLLTFAAAAEDYTASYCNRKILSPDEPLPEDDPDAIHITPGLKMAMLYLVSHFYENRESTSPLSIKQVPMTFEMLANSKRLSQI